MGIKIMLELPDELMRLLDTNILSEDCPRDTESVSFKQGIAEYFEREVMDLLQNVTA